MDVGGQFLLLLLLKIKEWMRESLTTQGRGEREKIIYKAILHINCVLNRLIWVVFEQKCVKFATFSILH